jgi:hypothetical protein
MTRKKTPAIPRYGPVVPVETALDTEAIMVMPDGRRMHKTNIGHTRETIEAMRAGYVCVKCFERFAVPFPDECSVCRFPMRDHQMEEFAKDFRGETRFGPSTSLDEERGIMNEMREREAYERALRLGLTIPKPSIIVPRKP